MTSVALFGISHKIETFKESLFLLMQNKAKVVAMKFLVRIAGRLHRSERRYRLFLINVNPLKLVYMKLRVCLLTLL